MGHAAAVVGVGVGCTIGIAATTAASADVVIIQMKLKQYRQRRKLDLWQGTAVEELHCSDGGLLYSMDSSTILRRRPSWSFSLIQEARSARLSGVSTW